MWLSENSLKKKPIVTKRKNNTERVMSLRLRQKNGSDRKYLHAMNKCKLQYNIEETVAIRVL